MLTLEEQRRYLSEDGLAMRNPELAQWALDLLGPLPGSRVLDLACGSASLAIELAERGLKVTGLDLSIERAKRRCAARGVEIELIEQDMRELDLVEAFDAVINWDFSGLCWRSGADDRETLRRVHRALVPGGRFLLQTYSVAYAEGHKTTDGMTWDASTRQLRAQKPEDEPCRLYTPAEWFRMLEDCGLYPRSLSPPREGRSLDTELMLTLVAERRR